MTNNKFASGAFVFTRSRGLQPRLPEEVIPIALNHGFDEQFVPEYAGHRTALGRAIKSTSIRDGNKTYLLRAIKRTSTQVTYGIVLERKDEEIERLDHDHEATLSWRAEPNPTVIEGDHPIIDNIRIAFDELRGKLVSDDWTSTVTSELDRLGAVAFREDGRIYWVPPQSVEEVKRLKAFLSDIGVVLVMAEVETENNKIVTQVVEESVDDQLHKLELEVQSFDETQKPSMFVRRLAEYQKLRERAILYRDALGIGVERTEKALNELEAKVYGLLDVRKNTTVHRDGSVSTKGAKRSRQQNENPIEQSQGTEQVALLRFAGAEFRQTVSDNPDVLRFVSGDETAKSSVKLMESMGLCGKWQKVGGIAVSIQNSGPVGEDVSIEMKFPPNTHLSTAAKSLRNIGIEVA